MRGTVAKRIRKEVARMSKGQESKKTVFRIIKRFFTGKVDANGDHVIDSVNRDTVKYKGFRRVYQDMKRDWRAA